MLDLCRIIFWIVVDLIRPRAALEAEILVLRQQIIVLRNQRIIRGDACDPSSAGNGRRRPVQVATRARSRESVRHQLNIALRRAPSRLRLHGNDRALLVWITRIWPNLLDLSQVVKPETNPAVASRRLQSVLALEIPTSGRSAEDRS